MMTPKATDSKKATVRILAAIAALSAATVPLVFAADSGSPGKPGDTLALPTGPEPAPAPGNPGASLSPLQQADSLAAEGKYADAEKEYRDAIAILVRTRGPDDLQTLTARTTLGDMLVDAGQTGAAKKEFATVLIQREHIRDPAHPEASLLPMKVLSELSFKGKFADVEKEYRQALVAKQPAFEMEMKFRTAVTLQAMLHGAESPEALRARAELARVLTDAGEFAAAIEEYQKVEGIQTRTLGAGNVDTLDTRLGLARAMQKSGAGNSQSFAAIVDACTGFLGADHPETLRARLGLAEALHDAGDQPGAEKEYRAVLDVLGRLPGGDHPELLPAHLGLSAVLEAEDKLVDAEKETRAALVLQEHTLGAENPETLATRMRVAGLLFRQEHFPVAENEYRAILAARLKAPGPGKHATYETQLALADTLEREKKFRDALDLVKHLQTDLQKWPDPATSRADVDQFRTRLEAEGKAKKK